MLDVIFQPASDLSGLPVDQVRYIILLFASYPLAMVFRHALHPSHTLPSTRHFLSAMVGVAWAAICFERQVFILLGVVAISYILLHVLPPSVVQRYTMVWVMGCMCFSHIYRTLTDYGGYHLDFTGPLMVLVQKLSLVAFAVHDGRGGNPRPLNEDQEKHKLETIPSPLEYFSYTFSFHTVLAGPAVTMKEHLAFMDGSNFKLLDNPNQFARANEHSKEPSAVFPVLSKLVLALLLMAAYVYSSDYETKLVIEPSYSLPYRMLVAYLVGFHIRLGYYFIWTLADSISNAAGLGFSGYDSVGNAQWDLATNVHIWNVEFAMHLRTVANNWNVKTSLWLRRVCYERVTWYPNHMSFALSAVWHGLYPGYYACFLYLTFALAAAKKMRRLINPFFTSNGLVVKWSYHLATIALTHIYLGYGTIAFALMWLPEVFLYWKYHYFFPIWTTLIVLLLLPSARRPRRGEDEDEADKED